MSVTQITTRFGRNTDILMAWFGTQLRIPKMHVGPELGPTLTDLMPARSGRNSDVSLCNTKLKRK